MQLKRAIIRGTLSLFEGLGFLLTRAGQAIAFPKCYSSHFGELD